jgi:hypothetical protein
VPLKVLEAVRKIIARSGKHSPPEVHKLISSALVSRIFADRLDAMRQIDYTECVSMSMESKKAVAFQLAQIIALIEGIELPRQSYNVIGKQLYIKDDVIQDFPDLESFIRRKEELVNTAEAMSVLNKYKDRFLRHLEGISIHQKGNK